MFGIIDYGLFVLSGILLNITPGVDTFYIIGRSISGGRKAGILSALGVGSGCLIHTILAAFGLSLILTQYCEICWRYLSDLFGRPHRIWKIRDVFGHCQFRSPSGQNLCSRGSDQCLQSEGGLVFFIFFTAVYPYWPRLWPVTFFIPWIDLCPYRDAMGAGFGVFCGYR